MLFNSFTYLVFLPLVVLLYWFLPRSFGKTLLLVASYVFYMHWMPAYGLLILALTAVNYGLGLGIAGRPEGKKKSLLLWGLVFNLGGLCFFKYANFLVDSFWQIFKLVGTPLHIPGVDVAHSPALSIILPLGISFFTFEFIHYITDVYRGSAPIRNFRDFALFAAFFPSQIAGPIKRFQDFVKQLDHVVKFDWNNFNQGMFLILQGLFKKVVLGDNLGKIVNAGFNSPAGVGTLDAWIAVAGFTYQIFFDFSGYTDIGRGSALLFGFKVPENFNWPFLAANLTDFWRRWHISLSTWLRDYLFIPLGGSRGGAWKTRRNTMTTMVLGGLWHGAAWHYVIWGAFHGTGLVLSKEWTDFVAKVPALNKLRPHPLWHWSGVAFTTFFLYMAGTIFRAEGIPQALVMVQKLFIPAASGQVTRLLIQSTVPASLIVYFLFLFWQKCEPTLEKPDGRGFAANLLGWAKTSVPLRVVSYVTVAMVILGFAPSEVAPFIYFQF